MKVRAEPKPMMMTIAFWGGPGWRQDQGQKGSIQRHLPQLRGRVLF